MANHDEEHFEDKIDELHALHSKATGKPSQTGAAEAFDVRGTTDTLSWGGGQHVATQAWGDDTKFPAGPAGTDAKTITASKPELFTPGLGPSATGGGDGNWNMDKIAGTPISNPGAVKARQ